MKQIGWVLTLVAVLGLLAISAMAADTGSYTGYLTDSKCAPKVDAACAKKCIKNGASAVLVNDADKSVITIANPQAVEDHIGHHVTLHGTMENSKLNVAHVEMVEEKK